MYERGSEWRKWDLHVHTPFSILNNNFSNDWDKYVYELFVRAIKHDIAVIGITDYYSIDGYKKLKTEYIENPNKLKVLFAKELKSDPLFLDKVHDITLFPNIEFRFGDIIQIGDKDNKIEGHFIFSDDISIEDIENKFLAKINFSDGMDTRNTDRSPLIYSNIEDYGKRIKAQQPDYKGSNYRVGLECLIVNFDDVLNVLEHEQAVAFKDKYAVLMPEDHITQINWKNGARDVRRKYYVKAHGIFSTNEKTIQWGLQESTKDEFGSYMPCFSCSDAHKIDDLFKFKSNKPCWIKADPTFLGLRQVFFQPQERIFIGEEPKSIKVVNHNKFNYIDEIIIQKNATAKNEITWFDAKIPLNSGLIAIIGNKGSGKSALADVLGYMINGTNNKYASFLSKTRFCKEDRKYANDYLAQLIWRDGRSVGRTTLNEEINDVPFADYLPQKYIEEVCNELNDSFQIEINNVIFSYIEKSNKLGALTLEELLAIKTQDINYQMQLLKNKIELCVKDIVLIERKMTNKYKQELLSTLKQKEEFLRSHDASKPPQATKPEMSQASEEIEKLNKQLIDIDKDIENRQTILSETNIKIETLKRFIQKYDSIIQQVSELNEEANRLTKEIGIAEQLNITITSRIDIIDNKIKELEKETTILSSDLEDSADGINQDSISLVTKRSNIEARIKELLSNGEDADIRYQRELQNIKVWEEARKEIVGDKTTEGTIEFCKSEIEYLKTNIYNDLHDAQAKLIDCIKSIYNLYLKKMEVYRTIYSPIEEKLSAILGDNPDNVQFETVLKLDSRFSTTFLSNIRQNVDSVYKGKREGTAEIEKMVRECDFNSWTGFELFITKIQDSISKDKDKIDKLLINIETCYNYIFKLEYLDVQFSLKMDGKTLEELSPGQRGYLLLVFYLALNRKSIPIIIDQPEDNLDNQSVYKKLVPCILEAKKHRQVIIVTHNPNIAVACDAEQIICASIDKSTNKVTYISGSIENPIIKKSVVDVLEGTLPAFELRRIKYLDN